MTRNLVLGIDPGAGGAIAIYDLEQERLVQADALPTVALPRNGKKRTALDGYALAGVLWRLEARVKLLVCEDVHAHPKQGLASTFSFGLTTGIIQGVVAAYQIPAHFCPPQAWKKALGVSSDKDLCRRKATTLFPYAADYWRRRSQHDEAEAALLAWYGARFVLGEGRQQP